MVYLGGIPRATGVCLCNWGQEDGLDTAWLLVLFPVCVVWALWQGRTAWLEHIVGAVSERNMRKDWGPTVPFGGLLLVTSLPLHRPPPLKGSSAPKGTTGWDQLFNIRALWKTSKPEQCHTHAISFYFNYQQIPPYFQILSQAKKRWASTETCRFGDDITHGLNSWASAGFMGEINVMVSAGQNPESWKIILC